MGKVTVGGDPESYMDAPRISADDKDKLGGGGSIIASVLDLLGVHKQVAKNPADPATTQTVPAANNIPTLDIAESVFSQGADYGQSGDWGKQYLKGLSPIKSIDPNEALKGF